MAYKQGIPLLEAFEEGKDHQSDEDSEDENPFTPDAVKIKSSKGRLGSEFCTWKHWLFLGLVTMIVLVILLLAVTLPFALIQEKPTGAPQPTATPLPALLPVTKSPHDSRDYGYFTLDNGLRVLLVSDNETQLSAAAMDVAVGSFSDPPSHIGLAHFCEHMLFYASDKYPQEGAYSDYLSRHGGYDNAYTSTENTNYFFRVGSEYLREALDRFAQFFISPILSQSGVGREVNAVDAEHRKNLQNDNWRLWQLLKHISNPYHPFHQFSTGDLETLDKPDVLSVLKDFYYKYYSANQVSAIKQVGVSVNPFIIIVILLYTALCLVDLQCLCFVVVAYVVKRDTTPYTYCTSIKIIIMSFVIDATCYIRKGRLSNTLSVYCLNVLFNT